MKSKLSRSILWVSLSTLLLLSCTQTLISPRDSRQLFSEPPLPYDYKIAYGADPKQYGELRLPARRLDNQDYPLAVIIHGGCWLNDYDSRYMSALSHALSLEGIITWNIEYRCLGDIHGSWPEILNDVLHGVDYLQELAKHYPVNLQKVILVGHSSGGHLALLAADYFTRTPDSLHPAAVVSLAGITDLQIDGSACDAQLVQLMNGARNDYPERYARASPVNRLPLQIKQVIVLGTHDKIIPLTMITQYVERAKSLGDDVQLQLLPSTGHFEIVDPQSRIWPKIRQVILGAFEQ